MCDVKELEELLKLISSDYNRLKAIQLIAPKIGILDMDTLFTKIINQFSSDSNKMNAFKLLESKIEESKYVNAQEEFAKFITKKPEKIDVERKVVMIGDVEVVFAPYGDRSLLTFDQHKSRDINIMMDGSIRRCHNIFSDSNHDAYLSIYLDNSEKPINSFSFNYYGSRVTWFGLKIEVCKMNMLVIGNSLCIGGVGKNNCWVEVSFSKKS